MQEGTKVRVRDMDVGEMGVPWLFPKTERM